MLEADAGGETPDSFPARRWPAHGPGGRLRSTLRPTTFTAARPTMIVVIRFKQLCRDPIPLEAVVEHASVPSCQSARARRSELGSGIGVLSRVMDGRTGVHVHPFQVKVRAGARAIMSSSLLLLRHAICAEPLPRRLCGEPSATEMEPLGRTFVVLERSEKGVRRRTRKQQWIDTHVAADHLKPVNTKDISITENINGSREETLTMPYETCWQ